MKKEIIRFVQSKLKLRDIDPGPEDGILGNKTLSALNQIREIPLTYSKSRKVVAFIQVLARENNIEAGPTDGYWGPQTAYAYETLVDMLDKNKEPRIWRPEDLPDINPNGWPHQDPQSELFRFYGHVGENQTMIEVPYPHRLSWNTAKTIFRFYCHQKVHNSLLKVLTNVLDHYGIEEIRRLRLDLWGGCLNVRKMRGGSKYSMHSWGIAVDYDPVRNQ